MICASNLVREPSHHTSRRSTILKLGLWSTKLVCGAVMITVCSLNADASA